MASGSGTLRQLFEVHGELGRGGMGTVYRATQRALEREVALKVLDADFAGDEVLSKRFVDEARLTAAVVDPCVVRVLDVGFADGLAYIAYELVRGQNVQVLLEQRALSREIARGVALDLLSALAALHAHGILHRDVKPSNLVVGGDARAKLIDLGIARELADQRQRTRAGTVMGTPGFVSPEQIRGEPLTPAVDVYAAGAVMYALATGSVPYPGTVGVEILKAQMAGPPRAPAEVNPDADPVLGDLSLKALVADPRERATVQQLRDALAPYDRRSMGIVVPPELARSAKELRAGGSRSGMTRPAGLSHTIDGGGVVAARNPNTKTGVLRQLRSMLMAIGLTGVALIALAAALIWGPKRGARDAGSATPAAAPSPSASASAPAGRPAKVDAWRAMREDLEALGRRTTRSEREKMILRLNKQSPYPLGQDDDLWITWLEIGKWLDSPASALPRVTPKGGLERMRDEVASAWLSQHGRDPWHADQDLFTGVLRLVGGAPSDGRGWLYLGRYLELDDQPVRAKRAYRAGLGLPHDEIDDAPGLWTALVRAMVACDVDIVHEFWKYARPDTSFLVAVTSLREGLATADAGLFEQVLAEGSRNKKLEPACTREMVRYLLEQRRDPVSALAHYPHEPTSDAQAGVAREQVRGFCQVGDLDAARAWVKLAPDLAPMLDRIARGAAAAEVPTLLPQGIDLASLRWSDALRLVEAKKLVVATRRGLEALEPELLPDDMRAALALVLLGGGPREELLDLEAQSLLVQPSPLHNQALWGQAAGELATTSREPMGTLLAAARERHGDHPVLKLATALWHARSGRVGEALARLRAMAPAALALDPEPSALASAERHALWICEVLWWAAYLHKEALDPGLPLPAGPKDLREAAEKARGGDAVGAAAMMERWRTRWPTEAFPAVALGLTRKGADLELARMLARARGEMWVVERLK